MFRWIAFAFSILLSLVCIGCGGGAPGTGSGGNDGSTMRELVTTNPHCYMVVDGQPTRPSCSGTVSGEARTETVALQFQITDCAKENPKVLFAQTYRDFRVLHAGDGGVTASINIAGVTKICGLATLSYTSNSGDLVTWSGGIVGDYGYPRSPIAVEYFLTAAPSTKYAIEVIRD